MLSQLNLNQLRIFMMVYSVGSMTKAAQSLYLTQSGVSQHIKSLEDSLKITLFDRVGRSLIPTHKARNLYDRCTQSIALLESAIDDTTNNHIEGTITIGAPPEFANNILSEILVDLQREHPRVVVDLQIGLASAMADHLLSGHIDIAFMDDFRADPRFISDNIFDERIELCAIEHLIDQYDIYPTSQSLPRHLPLLAYLPGEPILRKWYAHHFGKPPTKLNVVAYLSNSQNVARMITLGRGAGVLTYPHITELREQGFAIKCVSFNDTPLKNPISMNRLRHRTLSALEERVSRFFIDRFAMLGIGNDQRMDHA